MDVFPRTIFVFDFNIAWPREPPQHDRNVVKITTGASTMILLLFLVLKRPYPRPQIECTFIYIYMLIIRLAQWCVGRVVLTLSRHMKMNMRDTRTHTVSYVCGLYYTSIIDNQIMYGNYEGSVLRYLSWEQSTLKEQTSLSLTTNIPPALSNSLQ